MSRSTDGFHNVGTSDTQNQAKPNYAPEPVDCLGDASKPCVDISAIFKRQTNLAVLVTLPAQGYADQWIPKKCLVKYDEINEIAEVHKWFADKNGLIYRA